MWSEPIAYQFLRFLYCFIFTWLCLFGFLYVRMLYCLWSCFGWCKAKIRFMLWKTLLLNRVLSRERFLEFWIRKTLCGCSNTTWWVIKLRTLCNKNKKNFNWSRKTYNLIFIEALTVKGKYKNEQPFLENGIIWGHIKRNVHLENISVTSYFNIKKYNDIIIFIIIHIYKQIMDKW